MAMMSGLGKGKIVALALTMASTTLSAVMFFNQSTTEEEEPEEQPVTSM